jgi:hypothetical protein
MLPTTVIMGQEMCGEAAGRMATDPPALHNAARKIAARLEESEAQVPHPAT